jgi:hypothetical protein
MEPGSGIGWILVATAVYFGIGALWYSPLLFMKQWQTEIKKKEKESEMATAPSAMVATFAAMLVLVFVLDYLIGILGLNGVAEGAKFGLMLWLGFVATTALVNNVFQNGSKTLFAIDQGYHLVGIVIAAAILAR